MSKTGYFLDTAETVMIQGSAYALRLRSMNPNNPVVLFLHGGPGSPDRGLVLQHLSPLARHVTIACWDQRGCGKAYHPQAAKRTELTIDLYMDDVHAVCTYLKNRFLQNKIILIGHSWGSVLGVLYAQRHPEDVCAYFGVGQCVSNEQELLSYEFVWEQASKAQDHRALKILEKIGKPQNGSYQNFNDIIKQRNLLAKYGGITYGRQEGQVRAILHSVKPMSKEYNLWDLVFRYLPGTLYCSRSLASVFHSLEFRESARELHVPVFLFLGRHDYNVPFQTAEEWFGLLQAPAKKIVWFEQSGHSPQYEEPEKFMRAFLETLREQELLP